jgi:hypothetical protein
MVKPTWRYRDIIIYEGKYISPSVLNTGVQGVGFT